MNLKSMNFDTTAAGPLSTSKAKGTMSTHQNINRKNINECNDDLEFIAP
ncbi:MAG: hypothetical protein AB2693_27215 [Candidatus Thiodiazotropha sp.]